MAMTASRIQPTIMFLFSSRTAAKRSVRKENPIQKKERILLFVDWFEVADIMSAERADEVRRKDAFLVLITADLASPAYYFLLYRGCGLGLYVILIVEDQVGLLLCIIGDGSGLVQVQRIAVW